MARRAWQAGAGNRVLRAQRAEMEAGVCCGGAVRRERHVARAARQQLGGGEHVGRRVQRAVQLAADGGEEGAAAGAACKTAGGSAAAAGVGGDHEQDAHALHPHCRHLNEVADGLRCQVHRHVLPRHGRHVVVGAHSRRARLKVARVRDGQHVRRQRGVRCQDEAVRRAKQVGKVLELRVAKVVHEALRRQQQDVLPQRGVQEAQREAGSARHPTVRVALAHQRRRHGAAPQRVAAGVLRWRHAGVKRRLEARARQDGAVCRQRRRAAVRGGARVVGRGHGQAKSARVTGTEGEVDGRHRQRVRDGTQHLQQRGGGGEAAQELGRHRRLRGGAQCGGRQQRQAEAVVRQRYALRRGHGGIQPRTQRLHGGQEGCHKHGGVGAAARRRHRVAGVGVARRRRVAALDRHGGDGAAGVAGVVGAGRQRECDKGGDGEGGGALAHRHGVRDVAVVRQGGVHY